MPKPIKPRNPHALNPLMRKGGVHEKSNGAKRAEAKRQWKKQSREISRDSFAPYLQTAIRMSYSRINFRCY